MAELKKRSILLFLNVPFVLTVRFEGVMNGVC
jgi:hypothetical protein